MKYVFYASLILFSLFKAEMSSAQSRTYYKDLRSGSHVPLYDCSIYRSLRNQNRCEELKRGYYYDFEDGGYAVNCNELRSARSLCVTMAEDLNYSASNVINCRNQYSYNDQERCEITRRAYMEGRFNDSRYNYESSYNEGYNSTMTTTRTTTVVSDRPVFTTQTTCDMNAYDNAVNRWRIQKEEQRKRGQRRATVGAVATIGGILLGTSNNRTVRAIGDGLTIGGVFVTTWGLVEMADADLSYPHLNPYCQTEWIQESRRVVVEQQECTTTRYSHRDYYSTRYYYEVNCSNKRYVTFEEFRPWDDGRTVRY